MPTGLHRGPARHRTAPRRTTPAPRRAASQATTLRTLANANAHANAPHAPASVAERLQDVQRHFDQHRQAQGAGRCAGPVC